MLYDVLILCFLLLITRSTNVGPKTLKTGRKRTGSGEKWHQNIIRCFQHCLSILFNYMARNIFVEFFFLLRCQLFDLQIIQRIWVVSVTKWRQAASIVSEVTLGLNTSNCGFWSSPSMKSISYGRVFSLESQKVDATYQRYNHYFRQILFIIYK